MMEELQNQSSPPPESELSKKERKALRRAEKFAQRSGMERARKTKKALVWIVALAALGAFGYFVIWPALQPPPDHGTPEIFATQHPIQGQTHIAIGSSHPSYNSNPPSSGWHYAQPADWGYYTRELPDEQLVHNLEHGGIWIAYRPTLDATIVERMEEASKPWRRRIIMAPRAENDADIALVAWGWVDKFSSAEFSEKRLADFIGEYYNNGPEKIPF